MKTNKLIIPILTGVLFAAVAHAQVDLTVTGSTACRKIMYDRAAQLFDAGYTTQGGALSYANSANQITAVGTMSNAIPSLGSTVVTLRFGMSGSSQGMVDLDQSNPIGTKDPVTGFISNTVPDISFADSLPNSVAVSVPSSDLTPKTNLCVLPFVFLKNVPSLSMANVTNITKEQAVMLMSSSGTTPGGLRGMPASFLGGADTNVVYLFGRDIGSGTRVGVTKCIGFTSTPRQWATNGTGGIVLASSIAGSVNIPATDITGNPGDGFASGGNLVKALTGNTTGFNIIGYAGEADAGSTPANGASQANWLSYEGVFPTHASVAAGAYPIWCYESTYMRAGQNTGSKGAIFNKLNALMADATWQATDNTVFRPNAVALNEMTVKRGTDGGSFTTTTTAGW